MTKKRINILCGVLFVIIFLFIIIMGLLSERAENAQHDADNYKAMMDGCMEAFSIVQQERCACDCQLLLPEELCDHQQYVEWMWEMYDECNQERSQQKMIIQRGIHRGETPKRR